MGIDVTWLGHSTVVLDLDGVRLIADPLLRPNAGILRRRGRRPDEEAWAGTDAVLLSHLHHDHAELASLRRLAGAPILTAPDNAAWLRRRGLNGQGIDEDNVGAGRAGSGGQRQAGTGDPPFATDAAPAKRRERPPGDCDVGNRLGGWRHRTLPRVGGHACGCRRSYRRSGRAGRGLGPSTLAGAHGTSRGRDRVPNGRRALGDPGALGHLACPGRTSLAVGMDGLGRPGVRRLACS